jgi:hypothetical protein
MLPPTRSKSNGCKKFLYTFAGGQPLELDQDERQR